MRRAGHAVEGDGTGPAFSAGTSVCDRSPRRRPGAQLNQRALAAGPVVRQPACFPVPRSRRGGQGLIQVPQNVVDVLEADGQADQVVGYSAGQLLLVRELLVRGRRRVDGQ